MGGKNLEGIVLRRYSSFYYVQEDKKVWECRLRGKQRLKKEDVIAGDYVVFTETTQGQGIIERILPRKTELIRPSIANVTQLLVVVAADKPSPNWALLDRLLVLGSFEKLKLLIAFNKIDLADDDFHKKVETYQKIGYRAITASAKKKIGLETLADWLKNEITVLAGLSGVGKSSLLNAMDPELTLKTGEVSTKLQTGKHTTRYVELLPITNGGFVADTPGFSRLELPKSMDRTDLRFLFPEIADHQIHCRFSSCLHHLEPECRVKEAVEADEIPQWRYNNYLIMLEEILQAERSY